MKNEKDTKNGRDTRETKPLSKANIKGIRLIIAGIAIFFVFFVMVRIFLDESKNFSIPLINNTTMFVALWVIIILFTLTFLFILLRNLIKLYSDRQKPFKGGRFKNRLVFFFISFSIIPTLLLFFFATDLITNGIDKWFKADIESIMNKFEDLDKSYYDKAKDDLAHYLNFITEDIKYYKKYTPENKHFLHSTIKSKMKDYNLDVVSVYVNGIEQNTLLSPKISLQEYKDLTRQFIYSEMGGADPIQTDTMREGLLIRSGSNFDTKEYGAVQIVIGMFFPEKYIKNLKALSGMVRKYSQLKGIKDHVKTTYVLLFIFITILVVFSASWLGLYLARGITVPVEKVVAAASEITKGNLDVRIDYQAKDEFDILIKEFNRMVSDLKENRDKLSRRTIELRQRRSITENILKNITTGVIALNARGEIIDINPGAEGMLGLSGDDTLKKHFSEVVSGDSYQGINQLIGKAYESNFKIIEREVDVKLSGKVLNLAVKITQIRNPINNKFSGILVVLNDLTELMRAQRMLVWREVAKRIAHEIKNPLTPITISSQRILKALELPDDKLRKIVEDSLNIIQQELDSIKRLANEFANFARLPELKFTKGDINQVVEKLVSVYSSIYSHIKFDVNLSVELPIVVKMDVEQMKRIFVNIIDNAVEAMGEKGTLSLNTRYHRKSQFIQIEIADDGPGISDEDKQKLFIPYFSNKSSGTGLGLAIAHNIIEEHNGLISVEDNAPRGARFIIELPA
jgi:two-component system, NtrC family, nitrogen regulation sensor histidine kinase NtrY